MTRARTTGGMSWSAGLVAVMFAAGLVAGPAPMAQAAKSKASAAKSQASGADGQVDAGIAALEAGKVDLAVQELTSAITGGKISQAKLARALYFRGLAYRKQNKPAQAIADFTSALWIKNGLDGEQRSNALLNRAAAYREAGLHDQAEADEKRVAATRQGNAKAERTTTASQAAAPEAAPTSSAASGGGLGGFFNALFGGGSSSQPPPSQPSPAPRAPTVSAWSSKSNAAVAGWGDSTVVRKANASRNAPVTTASTGKLADGKYTVQVAAVRSRQEAQAVAKRLDQLGATAGARDAAIEEAVMGNMGTLYRVSLGPFASSSEVEKVCPQLRQAGLDCLVISR